MRREVLSVSNTWEEAERDLKDLESRYEDGYLSIEEVYNENNELEGIGVIWECEE